MFAKSIISMGTKWYVHCLCLQSCAPLLWRDGYIQGWQDIGILQEIAAMPIHNRHSGTVHHPLHAEITLFCWWAWIYLLFSWHWRLGEMRCWHDFDRYEPIPCDHAQQPVGHWQWKLWSWRHKWNSWTWLTTRCLVHCSKKQCSNLYCYLEQTGFVKEHFECKHVCIRISKFGHFPV